MHFRHRLGIVVLCLALLAKAILASRDAPASGDAEPCSPGDTLCLALSSHPGDLRKPTLSSRCGPGPSGHPCPGGCRHSRHQEWVLCSPRSGWPLVLLGCAVWTAALFHAMALIASTFLCPAIECLAAVLGMDAGLAGITLFALANGAPDLLTQVAALLSSNQVDVGLAASAALGSGLFVLGVVFPTVICLDTTQAPLHPGSFLRDALAYLAAVALAFLTLGPGPIRPWQPALMLCAYCLYIGVCVAGSGRGPARKLSLTSALQEGGRAPAWATPFADLAGVRGKRGWGLAAALLRCPFRLVLHGTTPALGLGLPSPAHAALLTLAGPAFFLVGVDLGPPTLGLGRWATLSAGLSGLCLALGGACTAREGRPAPSRLPALLACMGFLQSVVWMRIVAGELVALLQAVGRAVSLPEDLLGATVLAWGQGIPDLVAAVSVAQSGNGPMALSACFGGPVFNILVAFGAPTLLATLRGGALTYALAPGVGLLFVTSVLLALFMLASVPLAYRWRLDARAAASLFLVYLACQLTFLAVEQGWL
uniref:Sodium/calcium exchanger membrane region domain-containing protein n=2 Tax=Auxenochlorella protothecoides TaxID=3075 RepID=A0A1D2A0W3_AUXPR